MPKRVLKGILDKMGYEIRRKTSRDPRFPVEATDADITNLQDIHRNRLSMTSVQRLWATLSATRYVCENNIPGDIVECGVYRGGNSLIAAGEIERQKSDKKIYLFDTFAGMTAPDKNDINISTGDHAGAKFEDLQQDTHNEWCYASLDDVTEQFKNRSLEHRAVFIKGDVVETLDCSENLPETISVLRLDTDWYQSTIKELEVLYPRLVPGGILLLDDYGHWGGAKKAVDEYFVKIDIKPMMFVTDSTGRGLQNPGT